MWQAPLQLWVFGVDKRSHLVGGCRPGTPGPVTSGTSLTIQQAPDPCEGAEDTAYSCIGM